jgi:hypothetical protein
MAMPDRRRRRRAGLAVLVALVALALQAGGAAPAAADTLELPSLGARNIAAAGGYLTWAAPSQYGGWRLVVRNPDGVVRVLPVAPFGAAPDPAIGSDRFAIDGRRIVVVYSRCAGLSSIRGCDVYRFQLNGDDGEERVARLASSSYSETAPAIASGRYTFVRRGAGGRPGVHYWRGDASAPRRICATIARETATNGTRVAYAYDSARGGGLSIRRLSGKGEVLRPASRQPSVPRSIVLDRYRATWLLGLVALQTNRLTGARTSADVVLHRGSRTLPIGTDSAVPSMQRINRVLTQLGLVGLAPPLGFG